MQIAFVRNETGGAEGRRVDSERGDMRMREV